MLVYCGFFLPIPTQQIGRNLTLCHSIHGHEKILTPYHFRMLIII